MSCFGGRMSEYDRISLDRFDAKNLQSTVYVLSHLHEDHTVGLAEALLHKRLKSNKNIFLYCSEVTEILLLASDKYKHLGPYIKSIPINTPTTIPLPDPLFEEEEKITVTLLPAFHCPGSVMCLVEGQDGTVLYTGDFRWEHFHLEAMHHLRTGETVKKIQSLYIDTTFCVPANLFIPSRQQCIDATYHLIREWTARSPDHVVYVSLRAQFGHEPLLNAVANRLNKKVHVSTRKLDIYNKIIEFEDSFTDDGSATQIHACGKQGTVEVDGELVPCCSSHDPDKVLFILPTTMYFMQYQHLTLDKIVKRVTDRFFRVCYSFHSSYMEIKDLLAYLRPEKVCPNVKPPQDASLAETQHRLNVMLKECKQAAEGDGPGTEEEAEVKELGTLKGRRGRAAKRQKTKGSASDAESLDFGSPTKETPPSKRLSLSQGSGASATRKGRGRGRGQEETDSGVGKGASASQPVSTRRNTRRSAAAATEEDSQAAKKAKVDRCVTPDLFLTPQKSSQGDNNSDLHSSWSGSRRSESELDLTHASLKTNDSYEDGGVEVSSWSLGSFLAAVTSSSVEESADGCVCVIDDLEQTDEQVEDGESLQVTETQISPQKGKKSPARSKKGKGKAGKSTSPPVPISNELSTSPLAEKQDTSVVEDFTPPRNPVADNVKKSIEEVDADVDEVDGPKNVAKTPRRGGRKRKRGKAGDAESLDTSQDVVDVDEVKTEADKVEKPDNNEEVCESITVEDESETVGESTSALTAVADNAETSSQAEAASAATKSPAKGGRRSKRGKKQIKADESVEMPPDTVQGEVEKPEVDKEQDNGPVSESEAINSKAETASKSGDSLEVESINEEVNSKETKTESQVADSVEKVTSKRSTRASRTAATKVSKQTGKKKVDINNKEEDSATASNAKDDVIVMDEAETDKDKANTESQQKDVDGVINILKEDKASEQAEDMVQADKDATAATGDGTTDLAPVPDTPKDGEGLKPEKQAEPVAANKEPEQRTGRSSAAEKPAQDADKETATATAAGPNDESAKPAMEAPPSPSSSLSPSGEVIVLDDLDDAVSVEEDQDDGVSVGEEDMSGSLGDEDVLVSSGEEDNIDNWREEDMVIDKWSEDEGASSNISQDGVKQTEPKPKITMKLITKDLPKAGSEVIASSSHKDKDRKAESKVKRLKFSRSRSFEMLNELEDNEMFGESKKGDASQTPNPELYNTKWAFCFETPDSKKAVPKEKGDEDYDSVLCEGGEKAEPDEADKIDDEFTLLSTVGEKALVGKSDPKDADSKAASIEKDSKSPEKSKVPAKLAEEEDVIDLTGDDDMFAGPATVTVSKPSLKLANVSHEEKDGKKLMRISFSAKPKTTKKQKEAKENDAGKTADSTEKDTPLKTDQEKTEDPENIGNEENEKSPEKENQKLQIPGILEDTELPVNSEEVTQSKSDSGDKVEIISSGETDSSEVISLKDTDTQADSSQEKPDKTSDGDSVEKSETVVISSGKDSGSSDEWLSSSKPPTSPVIVSSPEEKATATEVSETPLTEKEGEKENITTSVDETGEKKEDLGHKNEDKSVCDDSNQAEKEQKSEKDETNDETVKIDSSNEEDEKASEDKEEPKVVKLSAKELEEKQELERQAIGFICETDSDSSDESSAPPTPTTKDIYDEYIELSSGIDDDDDDNNEKEAAKSHDSSKGNRETLTEPRRGSSEGWLTSRNTRTRRRSASASSDDDDIVHRSKNLGGFSKRVRKKTNDSRTVTDTVQSSERKDDDMELDSDMELESDSGGKPNSPATAGHADTGLFKRKQKSGSQQFRKRSRFDDNETNSGNTKKSRVLSRTYGNLIQVPTATSAANTEMGTSQAPPMFPPFPPFPPGGQLPPGCPPFPPFPPFPFPPGSASLMPPMPPPPVYDPAGLAKHYQELYYTKYSKSGTFPYQPDIKEEKSSSKEEKHSSSKHVKKEKESHSKDRYKDTRDRYKDTKDRYKDSKDRYEDSRDRYKDSRDRYKDRRQERNEDYGKLEPTEEYQNKNQNVSKESWPDSKSWTKDNWSGPKNPFRHHSTETTSMHESDRKPAEPASQWSPSVVKAAAQQQVVPAPAAVQSANMAALKANIMQITGLTVNEVGTPQPAPTSQPVAQPSPAPRPPESTENLTSLVNKLEQVTQLLETVASVKQSQGAPARDQGPPAESHGYRDDYPDRDRYPAPAGPRREAGMYEEERRRRARYDEYYEEYGDRPPPRHDPYYDEWRWQRSRHEQDPYDDHYDRLRDPYDRLRDPYDRPHDPYDRPPRDPYDRPRDPYDRPHDPYDRPPRDPYDRPPHDPYERPIDPYDMPPRRPHGRHPDPYDRYGEIPEERDYPYDRPPRSMERHPDRESDWPPHPPIRGRGRGRGSPYDHPRRPSFDTHEPSPDVQGRDYQGYGEGQSEATSTTQQQASRFNPNVMKSEKNISFAKQVALAGNLIHPVKEKSVTPTVLSRTGKIIDPSKYRLVSNLQKQHQQQRQQQQQQLHEQQEQQQQQHHERDKKTDSSMPLFLTGVSALRGGRGRGRGAGRGLLNKPS